ncbi:MAG: hypothetical protein ACRDLQ_05820 [Solirubrobacterales bacterium]
MHAARVFERMMHSTILRFALVACAVLACAATALAAVQPGVSASKSIVLGKTPEYPESGCPAADACEVVARVTGIQMGASGVERPFRSPVDGQLVAWWLRLPTMRPNQISTFNSLFGGEPAARVAVLRRGVRGRFRLVRQSATQPLISDLGASARGRARYRLAEPLRVKEGDYVGLTAVTWVPAFAVNLDAAGNKWLASRPKRRCATPSSSRPKRFKRYYRRTDAHLRSSTAQHYRCTYQTARLLYWARIVPDAPAGAS